MPGDKGSYFAVFGEEQEPEAVVASQPAAVEAPVSASQPAQQEKLIPRTAESQGFAPGRNVIDLAELSGLGNIWNRKRLMERGFSYQDSDSGDIVTVEGGQLKNGDLRRLARQAAREEKLARRFGIGDTTGWSQGAIDLRRRQVASDRRYNILTPETQQTAEQQATTPGRTWNYKLENDGWSGDNAFYGKTAEGLLKALYENKQYDILDALSDGNGNITYDSMKNYQAGLGTGDEFRSGNFGENSLKAMLDKQYITQEQYNRLFNGLGTPAPVNPAPANRPAVAATAPRPATDWVQAAKAAGFGVGLDEAASNYKDLILGRVASWQKANGLNDDGKFGDLSRAKLGSGKFVANDFDSNGNYVKAIAEAPTAQAGKAYTVSAGNYQYNGYNLPQEWLAAGLKPEDVQYTETKKAGWFGRPRQGYLTLTADQANTINNYWAQAHKRGGKLMKYFQQGGSVAAQQVAQEQAQEQQAQLNEMFMALAKNPKETLMALQKQGVQPKQVIELAQKMADKNPAAKEALAAISQMSQMAKQGAKLTYIKRLRGECPEGYEPKLYRAGGKVCTKCEKIQADCKGGKAKKHENGGEAELVTEFKNRKKK